MKAFWRLAKQMLRERVTLTAALVFAFISAGGLGVGLVSLGPMLKIILTGGEGSDLRSQALAYNASGPVLAIPTWLIAEIPVDPFRGVVLVIGGLLALTVVGATANFLHEFLAVTVSTRRPEVSPR